VLKSVRPCIGSVSFRRSVYRVNPARRDIKTSDGLRQLEAIRQRLCVTLAMTLSIKNLWIPSARVALCLSPFFFQTSLKFIPEISLCNLVNIMCTRADVRKHRLLHREWEAFRMLVRRQKQDNCARNGRWSEMRRANERSRITPSVASPRINSASSCCSRAASKTWNDNRADSNRASFATGTPSGSRERAGHRARSPLAAGRAAVISSRRGRSIASATAWYLSEHDFQATRAQRRWRT